MKFKIYSHRFAENIVKDDLGFKDDYEELINVIKHIKDFDLEDRFKLEKQKRPNTKSLSTAINGLIRERLESCGWNSESAIFKEAEYIKGNTSYWRLDFAKNNIAIEVAFNHQEATAHNIVKPVLAAELNHVEKAIQSRMGVIICATERLKKQGGFDSAIGTYERFISFMRPYNNIVTIPLLIIGLDAPDSFKIIDKEINRI